MKWIFLLGLIFAVPILVGLFRSAPRSMLWAGIAIGFLPFGMGPLHLYVAPISWAAWPGSVKGLEISLIDAIALAILIVAPRARVPMPILLTFGFYFAAVLFSTVVAQLRMPAFFYLWQLLRTELLCLAVARATAMHREMPLKVLIGGGIGLLLEAFTAGSQYLQGAIQSGGTFGHQNSVSMASHFVIFPAIALLLAGRRTALAAMIVACEFAVVLTGGSRAGAGLFALGLLITIVLSCWHRMTGRKTAIAVAAVVTLAVAAPAMIWAINRRSEEARLSSNEQRAAMIHAARLMIADYPLGIGANQYVITANLGGYSDRAGVAWNSSNRAAPVHNSYYLIAAELGIMGFVALASLLGAIILVGLRAIKHAGGGERSDLMVGAVASVIVVAAHFAFEWVAMVYFIHYLLAIAVGVLIGIRQDVPARLQRTSARPLAPEPARTPQFI
ncbi:MAG: O-antigen ligase family protein [Sphingomicrobium sp.]|nr:O-antigen ligase family protein [Sphingomonadales bacterium]